MATLGASFKTALLTVVPPTIFVSTGSGGQILAVARDTGLTTVIFAGGSTFAPEDLVVGPDGKIYVCNTTGNQIIRLTPATNPANPVTAVEKVFDNSGSTSKQTLPEGCSFVSTFSDSAAASLDLYFNAQAPADSCTPGPSTSCIGVWKIAGAATSSAPLPAPVRVSQAFTSKAEGIEFDIAGDLLTVDTANGKVLRGLPPNPSLGTTSFNCGVGSPNCVSAFIPGDNTTLSTPYGIAVNACGDILVADSINSTVNRYSATTGFLLDQLAFSSKDHPKYLEADATDALFVVTGDETGSRSSDGKVWRVDLAPPSTIPQPPTSSSCPLPANTSQTNVHLLIDLKHPATGQLVGTLNIPNALGLAVPATNFTTPLQTFSASNTPNLFKFGHFTFSVTCNNLLASFQMQVTALKSRPTDVANAEVTFSPSTSWPSTPSAQCPAAVKQPVCVHFASQHGYCTQFEEQAFTVATLPVPISDIALPSFCSAFTFKAGAFTLDLLNNTGGAHTNGTPTQTAPFTECQSQHFWPAAGPGIDAGWDLGGDNSKHVVFNSALTVNGKITLQQPVLSCTTTPPPLPPSCNPMFNFGQNIRVAFELTLPNGSSIPNATERLSILRTMINNTPDSTPQRVVSTNNVNVNNFFKTGTGNLYTFPVDSSAFDRLPRGTVAIYQFTIWGDGAPPFSFNVTVDF